MQNKNKIFINLSLAVVFSTACVFVFFYIFNHINLKNANSIDLIDKTETELIRRNKITALNSQIKSIAKEREMLDTHFIKSSDIVPFLDNLQFLAIETGAFAEVSSLGITEDGLGLKVEMKASGNFLSLYKLLALLQSSQYELNFTSISFESKSVLDPTGKIKINLGKWDVSFNLTLLSFINE